jgi:hypothetical protein
MAHDNNGNLHNDHPNVIAARIIAAAIEKAFTPYEIGVDIGYPPPQEVTDLNSHISPPINVVEPTVWTSEQIEESLPLHTKLSKVVNMEEVEKFIYMGLGVNDPDRKDWCMRHLGRLLGFDIPEPVEDDESSQDDLIHVMKRQD